MDSSSHCGRRSLRRTRRSSLERLRVPLADSRPAYCRKRGAAVLTNRKRKLHRKRRASRHGKNVFSW